MLCLRGISGLFIGNNISTCKQDSAMPEGNVSGCADRNTDSRKDRRPYLFDMALRRLYQLGSGFFVFPS
jgi:hypothetical protein